MNVFNVDIKPEKPINLGLFNDKYVIHEAENDGKILKKPMPLIIGHWLLSF